MVLLIFSFVHINYIFSLLSFCLLNFIKCYINIKRIVMARKRISKTKIKQVKNSYNKLSRAGKIFVALVIT